MTAKRYVIVLEAERGGDTAHAHTLRHLLKRLLRGHSLRCVELFEHRDEGRGRPDDGDGGER
jgi:hypothetical protein